MNYKYNKLEHSSFDKKHFLKANEFLSDLIISNFNGSVNKDRKVINEMLNSKYGIDLKGKDICKMGDKILQLEIEFNEKCGMSKYTNDIPEFMRKEKLDSHNSVYDIDKKELIEF